MNPIAFEELTIPRFKALVTRIEKSEGISNVDLKRLAKEWRKEGIIKSKEK